MLGLRQPKEWVWRRYAMLCFPLRESSMQPETLKPIFRLPFVCFGECDFNVLVAMVMALHRLLLRRAVRLFCAAISQQQ